MTALRPTRYQSNYSIFVILRSSAQREILCIPFDPNKCSIFPLFSEKMKVARTDTKKSSGNYDLMSLLAQITLSAFPSKLCFGGEGEWQIKVEGVFRYHPPYQPH